MCRDRASHLLHLRNDRSIQAPFTVTQVTKAAFCRGLRLIYMMSQEQTRRVYDRGGGECSRQEDNWIIIWLLWSVVLHGGNFSPPGRTETVHTPHLSAESRQTRAQEHGRNNGPSSSQPGLTMIGMYESATGNHAVRD